MQAIWTEDGHTTYWHSRFGGAEGVPSFVGLGPEHARDFLDGPNVVDDPVMIEGWFAADADQRVLVLKFWCWSFTSNALDADPILRGVSLCGSYGEEDAVGRRWLLAWLRAAWPGWTVGIARDEKAQLAALLDGASPTVIAVHPDEPGPPAAPDAAALTFRRMADAFAAEYYSYGAGAFSEEKIRLIKDIIGRLGIADWEPRHPDWIHSP